MFCAITGHVPQEPVVSTKSGHLFERRVIEKHLAEHGTCPITNESLAKEDLLPVKGPAKLNPRPASATSIPGLLSLFQSEWDAVMLETFQLRQQLQGLRKELSAALYQNDAACRVIARLLREKEELVARGVPEAAEEAGDGRPAKRAKPAAEGIPPKAISDMVDVSKSLSSTRKARTKQAAEAAASADSFKSLDPVAYPVHTTAKGGIHSVALGANSLVATAGEDSTVRVFDYGKEEVVATLKGHGKRVHSVIFAGDSVVSGSADGTVRIWSASEGSQKSMLTDLVGAVTSVTLQPSGRYFAASASSGIWGLYDLAAASLLYKSPDPQSPTEYISSRFHPDGVLLGCATRAATVEIWDLPSGKTAPAATIAADGAVHSLSFSENGYILATASDTGVQIWDLRKVKCVHAIDFSGRGIPRSVAFDASAQYLAVGAGNVEVYQAKTWDMQGELTGLPEKGTYAVAFGERAASIFVGSADHKLRLYRQK